KKKNKIIQNKTQNIKNMSQVAKAKSQAKSQISQQNQSKASQNSKVKNTVTRAEAIQQREQLRQKVLSIFIKDYAKNNKNLQAAIEHEVDDFFKNQKVTEANLKDLKDRVLSIINNKQPSQASRSQQGDPSEKHHHQNNQQSYQKQYQNPHQDEVRSQVSHKPSQAGHDDNVSQTSSKAPQSVYYMEGDEDDEWATLVKFDSELYKKELELQKHRDQEFKKKMKNELDKQLNEKINRKSMEKQEESAYVQLQGHQLKVYDEREKEKEQERHNKIMNEKRQRDKQVQDENQRKKHEKKREKELDQMLVQRIIEEKEIEEKELKSKKEKERARLLQMMKENEEYRLKSQQEVLQEKQNDVELQKEYTRLTEQMEQQRENEKKQREDKIKAIMSAFADSVVKDQKAVIREEDEKMMKHILDQNEKARLEELRRLEQIKHQKQEMREFLSKQTDEKKRKIYKKMRLIKNKQKSGKKIEK
ncbi:hypothetical protein IMG5_167910, partial [Ichthyophthirius multifiliis]